MKEEKKLSPNELQLAQIEQEINVFSAKYQNNFQNLENTSNSIRDLEDRLTRQREAINIFEANKIVIENRLGALEETKKHLLEEIEKEKAKEKVDLPAEKKDSSV